MQTLDLAPTLRPNRFSCSRFRISRLKLMIRGTNLLRKCDDIIMNAHLYSDRDLLASTLVQVENLKEAYQDWFHDWDHILQEAQNKQEKDFTPLGRADSRVERNSAAIANSIFLLVCHRMHAALGGPRALDAEATAQGIIDGLATHAESWSNGSAKFNAAMAEVATCAFWTTTEYWKRHMRENPGAPLPCHLWRTWLALTGCFPVRGA